MTGFAVGLVSMLSFVLLALLEGGYNSEIRRVILADVVGLVALLVAIAVHYVAGTARQF